LFKGSNGLPKVATTSKCKGRDKPPRGRYNPPISREILTLHPFPSFHPIIYER
jgi:hypothetical protein